MLNDLVFVGIFVIEMLIVVWVRSAKPSRMVLEKYPNDILLRTLLLGRIKGVVDSKDEELFKEYRRRYFILIASFVLLFVALAVYLYGHSIE